MLYNLLHAISRSLILTVLALSVVSVGVAQVRTSTNYGLQSDSINIGGGLSSSTNYAQESTIGEIATGRSTSTNYQLRAGYQQMQEIYLSLTPPADVIMSPDLPGITGGTADGSTAFNVLTDNPAGYSVTIASAADPAMQHTSEAASIANYPAGATPDFSFTFGSGDALFGYTVEGADIAPAFKDNGSLCATGSGDTADACWRSLVTAATTIISGGASNQPTGATSTLKFRVGVGSSASGAVVAGEYVATSTITALPL